MMSSSTPRFSVDSQSPTSPTPLRSEYPFPRPNSSSRYQPRRGSVASSIHSIGGALDTALQPQELSEYGQNAISTLLQPPIVRTGLIPHTSAPASSTHKPPTAKDIPPVTLTNIPSVDVAAFQPYLTQVGSLYDALQRAKENAEDGGTQVSRKPGKVDEFSEFLDQERRGSIRGPLARQSSLASLASSIEASPVRKKLNREATKRTIHAPTPLSTIPSVYFEEDFHLENPRTFDVVSERSEVVRPVPGTPDKSANGNAPGPRKALATNAILQEKLSWYMDTIEVHLISSISTASASFFAALGSLRELHSEAADSVNRIKALRSDLGALDSEMAIGGLDIVTKKRRRKNLKQLKDTVQQLKSIVEAVARCEVLVDKEDIEKALDVIDSLEMLIAGQSIGDVDEQTYGLRDLRGAAALQGVTSDLNILRFRVGKTYESRLLSVLFGDLRHHVDSVSPSDILQRWNNASTRARGGTNRETSIHPTYLIMSDGFRKALLANLTGLHRARHISPAMTAYRDSILRELRSIIRRPLPSSNDDDADSMMSASTMGGGKPKTQQEKSSLLARNLRALDPDDAEILLRKIYIGVGEILRRVGTQIKVLLDVTSSFSDGGGATGMKSPPRSPNTAAIDGRLQSNSRSREVQEEMHVALDMSNLLGQAVDIAQEKILSILKVRSEQSIRLPVEHFLRYFTLNLLFANECEAISGRSGTALKNLVNSHIKDFVRQLGESERQSLATGMEADPWNAKDFTEVDNEALTRILSASTRDAEAWSSKIWLSSRPPEISAAGALLGFQANGTSGTSTPSSAPSKASIRPATIESESFLLPVSATLCLHGISSFMHLNAGIPSMTNDVASSMISYLALFNSRCTQLILGAGATKSAGLKNITTKHLALAAQSLSFISSLIPHIREFIRRHAGTGTSVSLTMGEFDKVRRSYLEHQQSIYDKLVEIMAGRATAQVKAMKLLDWEAQGNDGVNTYMEILTKETGTLHRVLSKHLPEMTVRMIMELVFKSYKKQWAIAFGDVVLGSEAAKNRMFRDAELFKTRIGGIEGANDTGDFIVRLVKEKQVPEAPENIPETEEATQNGNSGPANIIENGEGGENST